MSFLAATEPVCTECTGTVELLIEPREKDLGEFSVRRVLPSPARRMVGPFIFFDHVGPAQFPPGEGIQVRPHPHIGLATLTYLFEGEIIHRDSLGFVQPIQAGAVNLMTAGRGIVHSERAGEDLHTVSRLHGIQSWMALPDGEEECDPAFVHHPASDLPELDVDGVSVRVITGEAFGARSPVRTALPMLYLECRMPAGTRLLLPDAWAERGAYLVAGDADVGERRCGAGVMAVASARGALGITAHEDSHVMLIGGDPVGDRRLWWNFVARDRARIEQAKDDWKNGRFPEVPGDEEFIPLPDSQ